AWWLQSGLAPSDNHFVPYSANTEPVTAVSAFQVGAMVIVTLGNPRDKVWGSILSLTAEGLSLCGVELASFDDVIAVLKEGGPLSAGVVFFPMHRVERVELDLPDGEVPSLSNDSVIAQALMLLPSSGNFLPTEANGEISG